MQFDVGDIIGNANICQIRIDAVQNSTLIEATIISCSDFYSIKRLSGENHCSQGFSLDEKLKFQKLESNCPHWTIIEPKNKIWFVLYFSSDGKPRFEYYR